jgi:hypothetical protein
LKGSIKIECQEINQSIHLKHKECQPYWFLAPDEGSLVKGGPSALTSATSPTDYLLRLMFKAARMIRQAGRWFLSLGESEFAFAVFKRHYPNLSTTYQLSHPNYN